MLEQKKSIRPVTEYQKIVSTKDLVINWHLLEPCNFACAHCFAQWEHSDLPLIYKDKDLSYQLLKEISNLREREPSIRISFAGGEPLLDRDISYKLAWTSDLGMKSSIITNGYFLEDRLSDDLIKKVTMIGVSIDSLSSNTNKSIGRHMNGETSDIHDIARFFSRARSVNPRLTIKINTVVNQFNWNEDLSDLILTLQPDKWKILRVLPTTSKSCSQTVTDEQYELFKTVHRKNKVAKFEDNDDMHQSYLMLDPYGRFFYNLGMGYGYTDSVLRIGIDSALSNVKFDDRKYSRRY